MLVINYNGNKPTTDYFKYSVQGNNKADAIKFLVSLNQDGLVFDNTYHIYAKVQCNDDGFYDKVELSNIEFNDSENLLIAIFNLESKHTSHRQIEVSLCCENIDQEIVWQTQIVKVNIANGIPAEEEIENNYPSVLAQLQQQIDELKQGGGGSGGATEVQIKRVWLSYDDEKSLRSDFIGSSTENNFVNDSTHIWYNFETTPINSKMEEEIKNGRFVIRLDYPLKNRSRITNSADTETPVILRTSTRKQGVGTRGYLYSFNKEQYYPSENAIQYRDILLNSLIFVNEDDIKINSYGEKYIHKKVSLFDYINKSCRFRENDTTISLSPITNEWINTDEMGELFFRSFLNATYTIGIPHTFSNGENITDDISELYVGTKRMKMYQGSHSFPPKDHTIGKNNSAKLNPAFTCYTPLAIESLGYNIDKLILESPYYIRSRSKLYYFAECSSQYYFVIIDHDNIPAKKKVTNTAYMSARPRCAILNDDYENNEKAFIKTYPQSDQQIKLYCKAILIAGHYGADYVPIFRTLITQK